MADPSSPRLRTVKALIDGYSSLSVAKILEPLSDDFTHHVYPRSLDRLVLNRASFATHAGDIFAMFDEFRMVPKGMFEDEAQSTVIVHARMEGKFRIDREDWRNECIMVVRLSRDGNKVEQIREFVDSVKAREMHERLSGLSELRKQVSRLREDNWWDWEVVGHLCVVAGMMWALGKLSSKRT